MKLELTNKQFRRLLDMAYIGNWILNATRGDDRFRDYDEVESLLFAKAREEGKPTLAGARACLEDSRTMPGKSETMQIMASAVGSACFCLLFGGGPAEMAVSFAAGFLLYVYILHFSSRHLSRIMANITGAALVSVVCILAHHGMAYAGVGTEISHMIIGAVIPMVPGVAFTNGIRDIADGDYIAGSVRLLDALLVFVCIAMGVGLTFTLYSRITGGMLL